MWHVTSALRQYFTYFLPILMTSILAVLCMIPVLTIGPVLAGYHYFIYRIVFHEDRSMKNFWVGIRKYGGKTFIWQLVLILPAIILLGDFFYFIDSESFGMKIFALISFYIFIGWLILIQLLFPLLIWKKNISLKEAFKYRIWMLKGNFWKEILWILPLFLVTLASTLTVITFAVIFLPFYSLYCFYYLWGTKKKNILVK